MDAPTDRSSRFHFADLAGFPRRLQPARVRLIGVGAGSAALAAAAVLQALLLAAFLASLYAGAAQWIWLAGFLTVLLARILAQSLVDGWAAAASTTVLSALRKETLNALFRRGTAALADPRAPLSTVAALDGIDRLDGLLCSVLPQAALAAFTALAVPLAVWILDPLSGLVLTLTLPLLPLFFWLAGGAASREADRQFAGFSELASAFQEALRVLPSALAASRFGWLAARLRRLSDEHAARTLTVLRIAFLSALTLEWAATLSLAVIAVEIGLRALHGGIAPFPAIAALLLAPEAFSPVRQLALRFHASAPAAAAWRALRPLLDASDAEPASPRPAPPGHWRSISFRDLSFGYPHASSATFARLSFSIPAGKLTAIVGSSGAGKSTALALLMGLYAPDAGAILLDDAPLASFDLPAWQQRIAWIPQSPSFFAGTLRENLLFGLTDQDDAAIWEALDRTAAADVVRRLPSGLDTRIGEYAHGLSSGQAQRIALARAALQDRPLVVLDEPAAFLDAALQRVLEERLRTLFPGRTLVVATHHRRIAQQADHLIVLDRGRTVAEGAPDELAARGLRPAEESA